MRAQWRRHRAGRRAESSPHPPFPLKRFWTGGDRDGWTVDVRCGTDAPRRRGAPRASKRADSWLPQKSARIEDLGAGGEWAPSAYGSGALTHSPQRGTQTSLHRGRTTGLGSGYDQADEKVWFKLVHRGLMVNGKEVNNKNCRLCGHINKPQLHLLHCPNLNDTKQSDVVQLLQAMDLDVTSIHPELTWLLGMTKIGQLLSPACLAIIRIHWKHAVYAAMVRLKYDGDAFSSARVKADTARIFLVRILRSLSA
eukprot:6181098-Pleurochrysis_carterae.AAC.2